MGNTFADLYSVTSISGRVYSRAMLLNTASRCVLFKSLGVTRAQVGAVLDDDGWMRLHRGEIPARVAEDAIVEALRRSACA